LRRDREVLLLQLLLLVTVGYVERLLLLLMYLLLLLLLLRRRVRRTQDLLMLLHHVIGMLDNLIRVRIDGREVLLGELHLMNWVIIHPFKCLDFCFKFSEAKKLGEEKFEPPHNWNLINSVKC
jgi:hypothetical protein